MPGRKPKFLVTLSDADCLHLEKIATARQVSAQRKERAKVLLLRVQNVVRNKLNTGGRVRSIAHNKPGDSSYRQY